MLILLIILIPIIIMIIGFIALGIEEDKDIWQSAWGHFKWKREIKKRGKYERNERI